MAPRIQSSMIITINQRPHFPNLLDDNMQKEFHDLIWEALKKVFPKEAEVTTSIELDWMVKEPGHEHTIVESRRRVK